MKRLSGTRCYSSMTAIDPSRLSDLRAKKLQLNQEAFAFKTGLGVASIGRAERGEKISKSVAGIIAVGLGEHLDSLFKSDVTVTIPAQAPIARSLPLSLPLRSDIQEFLHRHPYLGITVIDEFIELHHSPNWRGWYSGEVGFEEVGEYQPPPEFQPLLDRYKPGFSKSYYSLCGFSQLPTADDEQDIVVYVLGGSFHHVHALSEIFEEQHLHEDCRVFRSACEDSFLPISQSPLYYNVNCEVIVVTADDYIVLGRRRMNAPVCSGVWTASLEEGMLRYDPSPEATIKKDAGLFECAERGATGELGITVNQRKPSLLLSVGIEWRNFTAAFVFLINSNEIFATVKNECWPRAGDRNEAIALDCLSADPDAVREALSSPRWSPTPSAKADPMLGQAAIVQDEWHPTGRARLEAYLQHRTTPR